MSRHRRSLVLLAAPLLLAAAQAAGCTSSGDPAPDPDRAIAVGETREIELRFLRFDVSNFEQTLTLKDVLALPDDVKSRLWLLNLDLSNGPNSPRLLDNALAAIKQLDPSTLPPAARNLQRLLNMTPDTADLHGTQLEQLISLSPLLGISPSQVLADLMQINPEDTFLSSEVISETILQQVIATHPNAQRRPGPVNDEHPDGLYPVPAGFLPVTLADTASDFATLAAKYGPVNEGGVTHPGFLVGETRAKVLGDDFKMTVRANANALPYKGVDLTTGGAASVNSVPSQIKQLFDFDDPNWLKIEGLVEGTPTIESLSFRIVENPQFVPGGQEPLPSGIGSSPAWALPSWQLERILAGSARAAFSKTNSKIGYKQPGHDEPLFTAEVNQGWQQIFVQGGVGSPPPPSYLWDILLEVAQVRLHDGGVAEGQAGVEFTLTNIAVGTDTASLTETIRENLKADPASLIDVATRIIDNSTGEADFYYFRPGPTTPPGQQGDWLYFIAPSDIPKKDGKATREYAYENPGFYSDIGLQKKVSSKALLDGDTEHEKVKIRDGATLFVQGKRGSVYRVNDAGKPSLERRKLSVTRVK
jgi:hypothetical protein